MKKFWMAIVLCLCIGVAVPLAACNETPEQPPQEIEETVRQEILQIVEDAVSDLYFMSDEYEITDTYENQTYTVTADLHESFDDNSEFINSSLETQLAEYQDEYSVTITLEKPCIIVVVKVA